MQTKNDSGFEPNRRRNKEKPKYAGHILADDENNPCIEEADASYRCLHQNNFDRDSCTKYFLNYKNCRKFWGNLARERRVKGIVPAMPTKEERKKILENMAEK